MAEDLKTMRKKLADLKAERNEIDAAIQVVNKRIRSLDVSTKNRKEKTRAMKHIQGQIIKQNSVVAALRAIGKPVTSGPICVELGKAGIKIHTSEFSNLYKRYITSDPRIIITQINASKCEYSLREWISNR